LISTSLRPSANAALSAQFSLKMVLFKLAISNITKNYEDKFTGDENIFIDQDNKYGKLLDYAALYGKKDNKIFVGFQIKCYSQDTQLEFKFIDKWTIKNELKRILLDCKDLFNCEIKNWEDILEFLEVGSAEYQSQERVIKMNRGLLESNKKALEEKLSMINRDSEINVDCIPVSISLIKIL
jgi:hypothetical protein